MNGLRVALLFLRIGAMNDLQYRVNFFLQLMQALVQLGTGLIGLWLVFSHTSTLDGWTATQLLVVLGVFTFVGGVISTIIQPNMERLLGEVQDGTLDFALVKPEDAQLIVSIRQIEIWNAVDMMAGLIVLGVALARLQSTTGIADALAFVLLLVLGAVMIYSFWIILTATAFWLVRIDEIINLFQGVYSAGRFPVGIYPTWLRLGLTFLVPVGFAVTVPSEAVTGRLTGLTVLGALGLAALLFAVARLIWRLGLRRYSGASA